MTESEIDQLAWDTVRTVRDDFVGRRRQPTDDDWHEAIAAALLRVNHEDPEEALCNEYGRGYEDGYEDGYDEATEGEPNRFAQDRAA